MRKNLLILLINLLPMMWCSSQNTYPKLTNDSLIVITPQQLKATNLIFLEHRKLSVELIEYKLQISSYDNLIVNYIAADSLKIAQMERLMLHINVSEQVIQSQLKDINKLNKKNKKAIRWSIGSCTISISLLLILFLK